MLSSTYGAIAPGMLLGHFWPLQAVPLVRDTAAPRDETLDAAIRSGDYFITLATTLETIADDLALSDHPAAGALTGLIKELEYAQANYQIIRKEQGHRGQAAERS